jgi:cellulose synthase/poly-beta-1,6-N-acetylglucosamine synthase-like glycosyltransferase
MALLAVMLVGFWFLAAYFAVTTAFAMRDEPQDRCLASPKEYPPIALLYATCDDFQVGPALSCLQQDYPHFTLFILDDSVDERFRDQINEFTQTHAPRTVLVRRGTRKGFKAGNLNYALESAAAEHPIFAIADADEVLPPNFLRRAYVELAARDAAFVQANHCHQEAANSAFALDIGGGLNALWDVFCRPKNRFGFVACLGHGVLIKRDAWRDVGGFPEVVTEDLAFSAVLAEQGWRGYYMADLLCHEDFPASYSAFKCRQEKYVIGVTETLRIYGLRVLRARAISWVEKIDYFLWAVPLYIPALCFMFLLVTVFGTAVVAVQWRALYLNVGGLSLATPAVLLGSRPIGGLLTWDFQLFCAVCALAPAAPCAALAFRGHHRVGRLILLSFVPYMSLMVVSWRGILGYWLNGFTFFVPTGSANAGSNLHVRSTKTISERIRGRLRGSWEQIVPPRQQKEDNGGHWVWRSPIAIEVATGVAITAMSMLWVNAAFMGLGAALWIGAGIERWGWEARKTRLLCIGAAWLTFGHYGMIFLRPVFSWWLRGFQ